MDLGLAGKRVLITGASRGLGLELARAFAATGARLVLMARDEGRLKATAEGLGGEPPELVATDLQEPGAPTHAARHVLDAGPVDIVAHCVGGTLDVQDPLAAAEEWGRVWRLNAGIAIELNGVFVPPMRERGWGRVVHVSSTAATHLRGSPAYGPSKAYLEAYTRVLGREVAADGVAVTAIVPAPFAAPGNAWERRTRQEPDVLADYLERHEPLGRLLTPAEIAPVVLFLASEHGLLAAGEVVPVSAGST